MWNKFDARMGSECLHAVPVRCASIVCAVWVTDAAKTQLLCKALPASHSEVAVPVELKIVQVIKPKAISYARSLSPRYGLNSS